MLTMFHAQRICAAETLLGSMPKELALLCNALAIVAFSLHAGRRVQTTEAIEEDLPSCNRSPSVQLRIHTTTKSMVVWPVSALNA